MASTGLNKTDWTNERWQVGGLEISAKRWGTPGGIPILALHGWLDNCASFDPLARLMPNSVDLVCMDCAGHGQSGHRTHLGAYNIWQDVIDVFAVADQLGWKDFNLLGHSRGAMVAFLAAGTIPSRVRKLVMIEGISPRIAAAHEAPTILAEAITMLKASSKRAKQIYPTFDHAVNARVNGIFSIGLDDALVLAQRSVIEYQHGFAWQYDPKLMVGSEVRLSLEQVNAFRDAIPPESLLILANQGFLVEDKRLMDWLPTVDKLKIVRLEGGHHLHMHQNSAGVMHALCSFLIS